MARTVNTILASDDTPLLSRRTFFHGLAVTLFAAVSASQAACVVTTRNPPPARGPMTHRVYWREGARGRVLVVPRDVMVGDSLAFETGNVSEVRGVYPDRIDVARGHRTVAINADYE
jgi:hypothetical protein